METIKFNPSDKCECVGLIHTPVYEMPKRREIYPALVLCPGGGYEMVSERESEPVALSFFARGYNVFTLTSYSVGKDAADYAPLIELARTVKAVRNNNEWRCDPEKLAVCGFSAGAHLAASLGVLWNDADFLSAFNEDRAGIRPDAMILGYPVISAGEFAHVGSIENVCGARLNSEGYAAKAEKFSLEKKVNGGTCPAFLWHTGEDDCVPVENSLLFCMALSHEKIPFELHVFPHGGHGMSVCTNEVGTPDSYNAKWLPLAFDWLDKTLSFEQ